MLSLYEVEKYKIEGYKAKIKAAEDVIKGKKFLMSSTDKIDGFEIIEQLGLVFGEVVVPNGLLGAITQGTFFTIEALDKARKLAVEHLQQNAKLVGANAIIGIDIDICDLANNGMMVSANGTAVKMLPSEELLNTVLKLNDLEKEALNKINEARLKEQNEYNEKVEKMSDDLTDDELYDLYRKSQDKKEFLLKVITSFEREVSIPEVRARFGDKIDLMDLGAFMNRLVADGKLVKNEETKKYSVVQ